jgi:hypothetical protein
MIGFIYGTVLMYLLGSALMLAITDSADPDRPNAHIWLAATWPFVAVLSIYEMLMYNIRGGDDE